LPGRSSALSENTEQWERNSLGVVSAAGYIQNRLARQHPIFVFLSDQNFFYSNRKFENLKPKIAF